MARARAHVSTPPLAAVAWTIGAFLIAAAPHLLAMPAWLASAIVVVCCWRLLGVHRGWPLPPAWLRILLTLLAVALVGIAFGGLWGRRAATSLLCVMLAAKMLELRTLRDLRAVASVSFFLIAAQFLFDERLALLTYLLAGCLSAVAALVVIEQTESAPAGREPDRNHPARILSDAAVLLLLAVPVALVLFVTFPRLAQPLWGLPDNVMDAKTGLSDEMSPGSISSLYADDSPAFRVEFEGSPPSNSELYWRGPVLWHFDGDTWSQAYLTNRMPAAVVPIGPQARRYSVQLEPHERHWLFALDYAINAPDGARKTLDHQMVSRHPITTLTQYQVISNPEFEDMPVLPHTLRRMALHLPDDRNPRTLAMAERLRQAHDDDLELARAVLQWFRDEPFFYSLDSPLLGRHSADEFLFDLRTGYCEYYASAFAILMRAAGIPTRIVTGYQGGFLQPGGGYLLVRHSDAHAWVEIWLADRGWTRIDPTAAVSPERISQGSRSAVDRPRHWFDSDLLRDLLNRYDRLQHLWNRWVLGFDADRQQQFFERLGFPDLSATRLGLLMGVLTAVTAVLVALVWLWQLPRDDRTQRAWRRLLARLRRAGLPKRPGETPLQYAARIRPALANEGELLALVSDYCRLRYGPSGADIDAEAFASRIRRFRAQGREPRTAGGV